MVVPLREGADRPVARSLALRLSRLPLSQLLDNRGGIVVRERLVKGDTVRFFFGSCGVRLPRVSCGRMRFPELSVVAFVEYRLSTLPGHAW